MLVWSSYMISGQCWWSIRLLVTAAGRDVVHVARTATSVVSIKSRDAIVRVNSINVVWFGVDAAIVTTTAERRLATTGYLRSGPRDSRQYSSSPTAFLYRLLLTESFTLYSLHPDVCLRLVFCSKPLSVWDYICSPEDMTSGSRFQSRVYNEVPRSALEACWSTPLIQTSASK